jgi:hypothetical protein
MPSRSTNTRPLPLVGGTDKMYSEVPVGLYRTTESNFLDTNMTCS